MALVSLDSIAKQIATAIGIRLKAQSGLEIYQSSAVSLDNIPLSALRAILPPETSESVWDFSEASDVQLLGNLLSRWNTNMKGVTRALQTASESVIRVVASLMAIKLTYVKVAGVDKLKIELMYVLADGTGEVHWPKDETRRMIEVSEAKEAEIRAQISLDVTQMSTDLAKFPLSPEFCRNQLHNEIWAQMAEARIHNCQQLQQGQAAAAWQSGVAFRPKKVGKRAADSFVIEQIIGMKRGKYLVRWAGYVPNPTPTPPPTATTSTPRTPVRKYNGRP